jgi:hypothetical protein
MKRISSSLTGFYKIYWPSVALGLFVLGGRLFPASKAVSAAVIVGATIMLLVWAKLILRTCAVFMDEERLTIRKCGAEIHVPFSMVLSCERVLSMNHPIVRIAWRNANGPDDSVLFFPSRRLNGWLSGNLEAYLQEKCCK